MKSTATAEYDVLPYSQEFGATTKAGEVNVSSWDDNGTITLMDVVLTYIVTININDNSVSISFARPLPEPFQGFAVEVETGQDAARKEYFAAEWAKLVETIAANWNNG